MLETLSNYDVAAAVWVTIQLSVVAAIGALIIGAIVAVPDDSAGVCQAVKAAKDAGIPFYTIDRSVSGCAVNMTVLSDNFLAGQQSGEDIVAFLMTLRRDQPP